MRTIRKTVTTAGSAGSAAGTAEINVNAKVYAIKLDYVGLPASTDVTISEGTTEVYSKSNSNTDDTFYPRAAAHKVDGTASTLTEVLPIVEKLVVAVANSDAGSLVVTVYTE